MYTQTATGRMLANARAGTIIGRENGGRRVRLGQHARHDGGRGSASIRCLLHLRHVRQRARFQLPVKTAPRCSLRSTPPTGASESVSPFTAQEYFAPGPPGRHHQPPR